jgi:hypothetical protein
LKEGKWIYIHNRYLSVSISEHAAVIKVGAAYHHHPVVYDQQLVVHVYLIRDDLPSNHAPIAETKELEVVRYPHVRDSVLELPQETLRTAAYSEVLVVHNITHRSVVQEVALWVQRDHDDDSKGAARLRRGYQLFQEQRSDSVLHTGPRCVAEEELILDIHQPLSLGYVLYPCLIYRLLRSMADRPHTNASQNLHLIWHNMYANINIYFKLKDRKLRTNTPQYLTALGQTTIDISINKEVAMSGDFEHPVTRLSVQNLSAYETLTLEVAAANK